MNDNGETWISIGDAVIRALDLIFAEWPQDQPETQDPANENEKHEENVA